MGDLKQIVSLVKYGHPYVSLSNINCGRKEGRNEGTQEKGRDK